MTSASWSLVAALCAAVVLLCLWRRPPLHRLRVGEPEPRRLPPRLRPRPDAMAPRLRAGLGALLAFSLVVLLVDLGVLVAAGAGAAVGIAAYVGFGLLEPTASVRRREQLAAELPQALRLTAAVVEAGLPLRRAFGAVAEATGGEVERQLEVVLSQVRVGVSESDAWLAHRQHPVLGPLARDLARAVGAGTAVKGVLLHRADELEEEHRSAVEKKAKAVGVSIVLPLSACFLPAFALLGVVPALAGMLAPVLTALR